jgi:uncharacterized protein DUF4267
VAVLTLLCYLLALALVLVGVAGLVFPDLLSNLYGVRVGDGASHGYVRATAVRDIGIGGALAIAAYAHVLLLTAIGLLISFADFAIVFNARGKRIGVSHAGHAAGAIAFIVALGMALFAIGR